MMPLQGKPSFDDAKLVDKQFWKFDMGVQNLAWNFEIGPLPQQMHGLWARVRVLPSHYMQTFEEMIQYGFIEGWLSTCFSPLALPTQRFLAHQVQDVQMPLTRGPIAHEDAIRRFRVEDLIESVRPLHPSLRTQTIPNPLVDAVQNLFRRYRRAGLVPMEGDPERPPQPPPRQRVAKKTWSKKRPSVPVKKPEDEGGSSKKPKKK